MINRENYDQAVKEYEDFIADIKDAVLSEFPDFKPLRNLSQYIIKVEVHDKVSSLIIGKDLPVTLRVLLYTAFDKFMLKYSIPIHDPTT